MKPSRPSPPKASRCSGPISTASPTPTIRTSPSTHAKRSNASLRRWIGGTGRDPRLATPAGESASLRGPHAKLHFSPAPRSCGTRRFRVHSEDVAHVANHMAKELHMFGRMGKLMLALVTAAALAQQAPAQGKDGDTESQADKLRKAPDQPNTPDLTNPNLNA